MRLMFNGKEYFGPRGPAGPDGNPIGTVISYLGLSVPRDYLACDGGVYGISDYPDLAEFFVSQFGAANHFGGDGETTFAVPDLRNLFLRGYHGWGEEQLSGEIGLKQDATKHLYSSYETMYAVNPWKPDLLPESVDSETNDSLPAKGRIYNVDMPANQPSHYTSRPVNAAVLYCIKAVESFQAQDIYSLEETRVGTWVDGRPVYRKILLGTITSSGAPHVPQGFDTVDDVELVFDLDAMILKESFFLPVPQGSVQSLEWSMEKNSVMLTLMAGSVYVGSRVLAIAKYIKTETGDKL